MFYHGMPPFQPKANICPSHVKKTIDMPQLSCLLHQSINLMSNMFFLWNDNQTCRVENLDIKLFLPSRIHRCLVANFMKNIL
jgi:hypothetical protein